MIKQTHRKGGSPAPASPRTVSPFSLYLEVIFSQLVSGGKKIIIYADIFLYIADSGVWFCLFPSSHLFPVGPMMNDVQLICQRANAEQVSESTSRGRPCHMTVPSTTLSFYYYFFSPHPSHDSFIARFLHYI